MKILKYLPLLLTNFWGVLNDNFLKNLICFISVSWYAKEMEGTIIAIAGAMLVFPYLIFSSLAGRLSRTMSKVRVIRLAKLAEIPIMAIAISGFYFENIYINIFGVMLMGIQSALFSPAKYGLVRDIGGVENVSLGTGALEMITFIALLLGTFVAGVVSDIFWVEKTNALLIMSAIAIGVALAGWGNSYVIKAEESEPEQKIEGNNIAVFLRRAFKTSFEVEGLFFAILGLSLFWLVGGLIQMNLYVHCKYIYGMSSGETGMLVATVAISIGAGCGLAGVISSKRANISLSVIGSLAMSILALIVGIWQMPVKVFYVIINLIAFFGGLFKVPLNSWIQIFVKGRALGDIIAFNNFAVFSFILLASGIFALVEGMFGSFAVFLVVGGVSLLSFLFLIWKKPILSRKPD